MRKKEVFLPEGLKPRQKIIKMSTKLRRLDYSITLLTIVFNKEHKAKVKNCMIGNNDGEKIIEKSS